MRRRGWASTRIVIGQDPAPPALAKRNLWRRPGSTVNLVKGTLGPFGWRPRPFTKRMAGFAWLVSVNEISPECCHWLTRITWLESSMSYNALWGSLMSACFTINAPNMPFETSSPANRTRYRLCPRTSIILQIIIAHDWKKDCLIADYVHFTPSLSSIRLRNIYALWIDRYLHKRWCHEWVYVKWKSFVAHYSISFIKIIHYTFYIYTHETEVLFSNVVESNVISRLIGWDNEKNRK